MEIKYIILTIASLCVLRGLYLVYKAVKVVIDIAKTKD
jgi:hypothetical protein